MPQTPIYHRYFIQLLLEIFSRFIFILKKHIEAHYLVEDIKGWREFVLISFATYDMLLPHLLHFMFQYIELIFQFPYLGLRFLHNFSAWRKKRLKYVLIAHKFFFWSWELYLLLFNPPLLSTPLRSDFMPLATHHTL